MKNFRPTAGFFLGFGYTGEAHRAQFCVSLWTKISVDKNNFVKKKMSGKKNLWRKNYFWQLAIDSWQLTVGSWQLAGGRWQVAAGRWYSVGGRWPSCLGAVRKAGIRCLHQPQTNKSDSGRSSSRRSRSSTLNILCTFCTMYSYFSPFQIIIEVNLTWTFIPQLLFSLSKCIYQAFSWIKKIPYQAPPNQLGSQKCTFWKNAF